MNYFISRTDKQMVKQLDEGGYSEASLIQIKVPMYMPYSPNQTKYERWDGEIEVNGIHYNYVKRKISSDTLYLYCLPNNDKTELYKAKNDYAGSINDVDDPSSNKKQSAPSEKKGAFENDYDCNTGEYNFLNNAAALKLYTTFPSHLINRSAGSPEQPPDLS